MSVHTDRAAAALHALIPDPQRVLVSAPVTGATYVQIGSTAVSSLTISVDLGSGPVQVKSAQHVLDWVQSVGVGAAIGRYAIVGFISGSPVVIGMFGSITQTL